MDRPKEAEESARRAMGLDPESGLPLDVLAEALLASSNLKDAEQAVNQAVALDGFDGDRRGRKAALKSLANRLDDLMKLKTRAFFYPALLIYLIAAYSEDIAEALKRRAPDETD